MRMPTSTTSQTVAFSSEAVAQGLQVSGNQAPLTDWVNEPTVMDLNEDLALARPAHDSQVAQIEKWLALREARNRTETKDAPKNRSRVQPKLVRRQAEWRYSALTEPFLSSKKLFTVTPTTWEDKQAADQNELLLNWQMRTKLNRVKFVDEYVRTAVDEGTVVVRPGWRRETRMEEVEVPIWSFYPAQDPTHIQFLQQALEMKQANPQGYSELPEDLRAAADYTEETGTPVIAQQVGIELVEEERVIRNHPTLEILDFRNVFIDPNAGGDLAKATFGVISFETSKAELLADGRYRNLDQVNWSSQTPAHDPDHATYDNSHLQFKDSDPRKRVVAYEYWGFYDIEGNGTLSPIVATWIGHTMIRMERNPYPFQGIPLVVVPYMPIKKSVAGEADAELLEDNQAILGAVMRGMIDLLGRSANGQTGFAKGMLDVVNRRRYDQGHHYEFNPNMPPATGIHQHVWPEIPNSAITMLQLQNQEAEALTGVKAFSGGLSSETYGQVATGIRGMLDAAAKREMGILRRLAQGMEEIGRMLIAMNAVFLSEEEVVQVTNEQYVQILREDLEGEFNLEVDISTAEVDEMKAQDLGFMLQTMGQTLPFEIMREILAEIAQLKRMPQLAQSIRTYQPQPDPLEEKRKELELAKLEAEIAEEHAKAQLAQAKTMETQARARDLGATADLKDLDFIEQETGTKHAREMDKQSAQARANQALEITKRVLEPRDGESQSTDLAQAYQAANVASMLT